MNYFRRFGLVLALTVVGNMAFGQAGDHLAKDWMLLDGKADKITGMSVKKGYSLLKGKKPTKVIVAVIDSGIDYLHEDLKDVMWTNPKEIAGNGIDDDNNGYIDDIHGWNFIGGKDGKNVEHDNLELTRLYRELSKKYEGKSGPFSDPEQNKEFNQYQEIKVAFEAKLNEIKTTMKLYEPIFNDLASLKTALKTRFGKDNATSAELDALNIPKSDSLSTKVDKAKLYMGMGAGSDVNGLYETFKGVIDYFKGQLDYNFNVDYDPRSIVGDNYANSAEKNYGNNDVKGPDASHGTHVAGIIGAKRFNNIGMDGIADYVQIMSVRVVPDGDERDKDVANGIRYAVDNGARVINMSFGKAYVKDKKVVDDAVKYAESKGVLLVHAAGNDGENIDTKANYPTKVLNTGEIAPNWIEVGALGYEPIYSEPKNEKQKPKFLRNDVIPGSFSNYGVKTVDVFAPGVDIYSTTPENNYEFFDGTSMASPACAGVAALLMSYFPNLSAVQIKDIIVKSSLKQPKLKVIKPGSEEEVMFSTLSSSGGIVNLAAAIQMASKMK